jgi:hypothetical protein
VLADLDALAERMGEAYQREIPEYAAMGPGEMAAVVLPTSRRLVTTFLDCVVSDRALTERELRVFEDSGRERLRLGLPLESGLHAFRSEVREAGTAPVPAPVPPGEEGASRPRRRWIDVGRTAPPAHGAAPTVSPATTACAT